MSEIAKSGFRTEDQVVHFFNDWNHNKLAMSWLKVIGYSKVYSICAKTTRSIGKNSKADILVKINGNQNIGISVKKFIASYNQIDKRKIDNYQIMWKIPKDVTTILKKYCGVAGFRPMDENHPPNVQDKRRYFLTELTMIEQEKIKNFFNQNKYKIISDVLKGSEEPKTDFVLVVKKDGNEIIGSAICNIEKVINHYGGLAKITKRGSLRLGKITIQRKGGDTGKPSAQMLQFKFSPKEIMEL